MNKFAISWGILLLAMMAGAQAQGSRDPTVPPEGAGLDSTSSSASRPAGIESGAFTIIVRNGVPSLVVGTRLYTRGQKLGNATIERIAETEVWLREGRVLRKVSQFKGIERRAASTVKPKSVPPRCPQTATSNVSCANDKP